MHHRTRKAKTLVRSSVIKPHNQKIVPLTGHLNVDKALKKVNTNKLTKLHHDSIYSERLLRAHKIPTNKFISRYGAEVKTTPQEATPNFEKVADLPVSYIDNSTRSKQTPTVHKVVPSTLTSSNKHLSKFLDDAMASATAHTAKHLKKSKSSYISGLSAGAALVLLFSFFAYQNIPNMSVKIASSRSGVHASLPGYRPSGFALKGPVQYNKGQLIMQFQANADSNRVFSITERTSDWNNESLLKEFVAAGARSYQAIDNNGKTIYMYEGNNATWLDKGTWYTVEDKASLNNDQLLKIINSI